MSDVKNAVRDLEERAKQGDTKSMVKLGIYHLYGDGEVARDYQQSRKWFEQAANQGDTSSMVRLGVNYLYGINGTVSDPQQAEKWFKQAAELGSGEALMALGDFYLNGHDVERALEKAIPLLRRLRKKGLSMVLGKLLLLMKS
jgi:TPR repeat protein